MSNIRDPRKEIEITLRNMSKKIRRKNYDDEIIGDLPDDLIPDSQKKLPSYADNANLFGDGLGPLMNKLSEINDDSHKNDRELRYKRTKKALEYPEIQGAMKIYADEACTTNKNGDIYNIYHPNKKLVDDVRRLFERVNYEDDTWKRVFNFGSFGDDFVEIVFSRSGDRVLALREIPRELISRVEKNSVLQYFTPRKSSLSTTFSSYAFEFNVARSLNSEEKKIEPFRILHYRIPTGKYDPYGESIIDTGISSIEKLNLMEQALMIARITRAPERRLYNINVGNLQGEQAYKFAERIVERMKKKKVLDFMNGTNVTEKAVEVFSSFEDIVIPRRPGEDPSTIDTLPQLNNVSDLADIEFIRDRLFPAIGIPRQYIFDDTFSNANQNLSNKDVKFAQRVRRIQRFNLYPTYKLAIIELSLLGWSKKDIDQLVITMQNPSNIDESTRLELENTKWNLISQIRQNNTDSGVFFPDYSIYSGILGLSNEEILFLQKLSGYQKSNKNIFYLFPKDQRPVGYEELDEINEAETEGGEGENEIPGGMEGMGGSMAAENTPPDVSDQTDSGGTDESGSPEKEEEEEPVKEESQSLDKRLKAEIEAKKLKTIFENKQKAREIADRMAREKLRQMQIFEEQEIERAHNAEELFKLIGNKILERVEASSSETKIKFNSEYLENIGEFSLIEDSDGEKIGSSIMKVYIENNEFKESKT